LESVILAGIATLSLIVPAAGASCALATRRIRQ
jgi:hypothetical protein